MYKHHSLFWCGLCLFAILSVGCSKEKTATPEAPKKPTLADSLGEVSKMVGTISDGLSNNDLDKAHGPLHEIGHKLEALPAMLDASSLADEAKTAAKAAIESLMTDFGKVDAKLHGAADGADFAEVKDSVEKALADLMTQTKSLTN